MKSFGHTYPTSPNESLNIFNFFYRPNETLRRRLFEFSKLDVKDKTIDNFKIIQSGISITDYEAIFTSKAQNIDFANEHLRKIFELLIHQYEEHGHFDSKEIEKSLITDMEMNTFSKLNLQVINNPFKYAAGCIYKMRKWRLDSRYNEILRLMKEESASAKSKSHYSTLLENLPRRGIHF